MHNLEKKDEHKFVHDRDWNYISGLLGRVKQLENPPLYKIGKIVKQGTIIGQKFGAHIDHDDDTNIYIVIDVDTQKTQEIPEDEIHSYD